MLNYLRLSKLKIGYLVNFNGTKVDFKRLVV
ncbi:GxxExxY protein [Salinispira pacifica]